MCKFRFLFHLLTEPVIRLTGSEKEIFVGRKKFHQLRTGGKKKEPCQRGPMVPTQPGSLTLLYIGSDLISRKKKFCYRLCLLSTSRDVSLLYQRSLRSMSTIGAKECPHHPIISFEWTSLNFLCVSLLVPTL